MSAKPPAIASSVIHVAHNDTRMNIPTEELRDFIDEDERVPTTLLYPRDPSLDPQLVWQGKDEQDRQDLAVPSVPIYVQEKIHPHALIEDLRRQARGEAERQVSLFADFDDLPFEEMLEFYRHEQSWTNRLILGDSLLVMASLAEKERLRGQVQMIYMDPPYGIKFGSNWQVSTRKRDVRDGRSEDLTRQPEQVKAFRDAWQLGIHSYLGYLRDRAAAARELLTESGSIFVQIGDTNVHLVRSVLDEVFGSENFVSLITVLKTSGAGSPAIGTSVLASTSDFILWYAKNKGQVKYRQLFGSKQAGAGKGTEYKYIETSQGGRRMLKPGDRVEDLLQEGGRLFRYDNLISQTGGVTTTFPVTLQGRQFIPSTGGWKTNTVGMQRLIHANRVAVRTTSLSYVRYLDDFPASPINNVWDDLRWGFDASDKTYVVETNPRVVQRCLLMTTDPGELVLDPTCGSGTTAFVAEQWGRRWITIDTSRVALALTRTRLMAARFPYYVLADSPEGVRKNGELTGLIQPVYLTEGDVKKGFVYRRVPHVTLKSIATNPDIQEGMSCGEIEAAISRHADSEILYDQPYEDPKCVRVSGPFTAESLSPHRVLSTDHDVHDEHCPGVIDDQDNTTGFVQLIIDNLKKAGVQNTVKGERLVFSRLESYAGEWIQAAGEYSEHARARDESIVRRVAVCVGPEHGTVSPDLVKDAAKEAVRGIGFDLLVICGFAFDPHVSEEAKRYGRLTVLPARMSAELMMGDVLKATGAGNLFTVFGEPDVDIAKGQDGKITITIRGLDVYDPTTGQVRTNATDEIACWFIDTSYDEQQFGVRHAYFTGGNQPYDRLRKALRAEIDEGAWASLYATTSRPFEPPKTGRIAIKVINHYGDEVLKVYPIR